MYGDKSDWRHSSFVGLKTVVSNFDVFLCSIAKLMDSPGASDSSLGDAERQCQAILGIARAQIEELVETPLEEDSVEAKLVQFERWRCNVDRLMARSDKMRDLLMSLASGCTRRPESTAGPQASSSTNTQHARPSMASISAAQRLMAPKSGKTPPGSRKPSKRSAPPALKRNDDGKHVRR